MPVEISREPKCGVCGREKGVVNRWFLIRVGEEGFCFRSYQRDHLEDYDEAICGAECLDKRYHAHVQKLIGMR